MDEISSLSSLLTIQNIVGLGLIALVAYSWWNKVSSERTIASDFKDLIDNLQNQLTSLKGDLRNEREFRQKVEQEKNDALNQVGKLTLEVQSLGLQVQQLQQSIDELKTREQGLLEKLQAK